MKPSPMLNVCVFVALFLTVSIFSACETPRTNTTTTAAGDEIQAAQASSGISGVDGEDVGAETTQKKVRKYVVEDPERCKSIRFRCEPGLRPFFDKKGCGCEGVPRMRDRAVEAADDLAERGESLGDTPPTRCSPESRQVASCPEDGDAVCGLFDPARVQCIMAPCGRTFANACKACLDPRIISWTPGDCRPPAR